MNTIIKYKDLQVSGVHPIKQRDEFAVRKEVFDMLYKYGTAAQWHEWKFYTWPDIWELIRN